MLLEIRLYPSANSELSALWSQIYSFVLLNKDPLKWRLEWPKSPKELISVACSDLSIAVEILFQVAVLSRQYKGNLFFISGKACRDHWGKFGFLLRDGKPVDLRLTHLPDEAKIQQAYNAHVDLQFDCDLYSELSNRFSKDLVAEWLGPPPWTDDPNKVVRPVSREKALENALMRIAVAESQIESATQEIQSAKTMLAHLIHHRSSDHTVARSSQTQAPQKTADPIHLPTSIDGLISLLFQWAAEPLDEEDLKAKLLAVLHPDSQRGIKDILRFNWPRFVRQRQDYLNPDDSGFEIVRVDERLEGHDVKCFLKASGRGPAPIRFRRDEKGLWRLMTISL